MHITRSIGGMDGCNLFDYSGGFFAQGRKWMYTITKNSSASNNLNAALRQRGGSLELLAVDGSSSGNTITIKKREREKGEASEEINKHSSWFVFLNFYRQKKKKR